MPIEIRYEPDLRLAGLYAHRIGKGQRREVESAAREAAQARERAFGLQRAQLSLNQQELAMRREDAMQRLGLQYEQMAQQERSQRAAFQHQRDMREEEFEQAFEIRNQQIQEGRKQYSWEQRQRLAAHMAQKARAKEMHDNGELSDKEFEYIITQKNAQILGVEPGPMLKTEREVDPVEEAKRRMFQQVDANGNVREYIVGADGIPELVPEPKRDVDPRAVTPEMVGDFAKELMKQDDPDTGYPYTAKRAMEVAEEYYKALQERFAPPEPRSLRHACPDQYQ